MPTTKCKTLAKRVASKRVQERFSALLLERKLHYTDPADAIGMSRSMAHAMSKGEYSSSISVDVCLALAEFFSVPVDTFLD